MRFPKHITVDILIQKSLIFLVFIFLDSLCKFGIFSRHKSGDKKEKFWSHYLLFLEECHTLTKADNDLAILPSASSRDIYLFSYQSPMDKCKSMYLN